ncbi:MAG: polyprenyl synthetase family protein [Gammaproteobacteria bacterium]|nr:polyprenyl synthetase family protein [Gammaproteobacteria bacterium]
MKTAKATLTYITEKQQRIINKLENILDSISAPELLIQAVRYSTISQGKYLRPLLVYATGECLNLPTHQLDDTACAIELIHCYSLIHDDLPAMDNDDYRRGKPSCHKAFTEATAILAGDGLQSLAFETLSRSAWPSAELKLRACQYLASCIGCTGMVGGQILDINAQTHSLTGISQIHQLKTGALFKACTHLPCLYAQVDEFTSRQLDTFSECLGLAFQIQDDLIDIETDTNNYASILGKDKTIKILQEQSTKCIHIIDEVFSKDSPLHVLTKWITKQK